MNPGSDPDAALIAWLDHEYAMFLRLEEKIVEKDIQCLWTERSSGIDVDALLKYSLSVHNRRKIRMGLSLEYHLEAVFKVWNIRYDRNVATETRRADFIFPGRTEYADGEFPVSR